MAVDVDKLLLERIRDLEQRVKVLEDRSRSKLWFDEDCSALGAADEMLKKYGKHISKTVAASHLGVTVGTINRMLMDGRLDGACQGRRVSTLSLAQYIASDGREAQL